MREIADKARIEAFAARLTSAIRGSELVVFDGAAHAPIHEQVEECNRTTLGFLQRHSG